MNHKHVDSLILIEIAYAGLKNQMIIPLEVSNQTTILSAIELSGISDYFSELSDKEHLAVGVFSQKRSLDSLVTAGDRVEIYRRLILDPKEQRRIRAKKIS